MRMGWNLLGLGATGLGLVGVVMPLLPTTPFLLLALVCFSRGSARCHDWIMNLPGIGEPLREWQRERTLRPAIRRRALAVLWAGLSISIWFSWPVPWLVATLLTCGVACSAFLLVVGRRQAKPL